MAARRRRRPMPAKLLPDSTHRIEARSAESYILGLIVKVAEDSKFTQTVETLIAIRPRPNIPTIKPRELFFPSCRERHIRHKIEEEGGSEREKECARATQEREAVCVRL